MKASIMGAIAGDTIGSAYEFNPTHNYNFNMMRDDMSYTDDTVLTIAVAEWLLTDPERTSSALVDCVVKWTSRYPWPKDSYGGGFIAWLRRDEKKPYGSWGNGSAMRVSPVGFACSTLDETLKVAEISAAITHNHPFGIAGAQATAAAIFMARHGESKHSIKTYISNAFGYDLNRTVADMRKHYGFDESCQGTVPESIIAFLESTSYEDAIRLTVSLGGDADTMGAITGAIAAAYYKEMPNALYEFVEKKLPADILGVVKEFEAAYPVK